MIQKFIQILSILFIITSFCVGISSTIHSVGFGNQISIYAMDEESEEAEEGEQEEVGDEDEEGAQVSQSSEATQPQTSGFLGKNFGCSIPQTSLNISNLFVPAVFLPVIPENCTTTPEGEPIPLSPVLIPSIITRLFGLIASLIFYLLFFTILVSGIMWTWGGIDSKNITQAKQNFRDAFIAIFLLLATYVIISTIIGILTPDDINTDINNLFFINTGN